MVEQGRLFIHSAFSPTPLCIEMKTIKLICHECGTPFPRLLKEHKRSLKLKRPEFCSLTCNTIHRNKKLPSDFYKKNCYDISKHSGNRQNNISPFRYFIAKSKAKNRRQYGAPNITPEYLRKLWDIQKGICPYTKLSMILPKNTLDFHEINSPQRASLDRIDSTKGYIEGNVEFVCYAINLAKNSFTREEMKEFIAKIGGDAEHCPRVFDNTNPQQLQV